MDTLTLLADPPAAPRTADGYLDLLDRARTPPPSLAQRAMQSTLLPRIYEDVWRPIAFNLAKGWPFGPSEEQEFAQARKWLGLDGAESATVLDVACGPGNVTRALAKGVGPGGLVVGIDMSPSMLEQAVRDTADEPGIEYVRGDAADLPFRDGTFDAVCCFGALYLFRDPWAALDSMTRVLRPGGRLVILTSRDPGLPLTGLAAQAVGMRLFDDEEVRRELASRGYDQIRRHRYRLMQMVGGRLS